MWASTWNRRRWIFLTWVSNVEGNSIPEIKKKGNEISLLCSESSRRAAARYERERREFFGGSHRVWLEIWCHRWWSFGRTSWCSRCIGERTTETSYPSRQSNCIAWKLGEKSHFEAVLCLLFMFADCLTLAQVPAYLDKLTGCKTRTRSRRPDWCAQRTR